jgi:hypothetical protein
MAIATVLLALVAGCGSEQVATPAGEEGDPVRSAKEIEAESATSDGVVPGYISTYPGSGVGVQAIMRFPESRHVTGIILQMGGQTSDAVFYTESFDTDSGDIPDQFAVAAGEALTAEGHYSPSCVDARDDSAPVLQVSFTSGGGDVEVEQLEVRSIEYTLGKTVTGQVAQVVAAWCEAGVQATLMNGSITTKGEARVTYQVFNPGPDDVTLTSRAGSDGDMRWEEAGPVTVPAGESASIEVEGEADKQRCSYAQPLNLGLLRTVGPSGSNTLTTKDTNGFC